MQLVGSAGDGDPVRAELDREQIDRADVRLAYVQHPFPAQGQTSDTAHLIVAEHATEEGCYVALTRARDTTTIHAAIDEPERDQPDQPQALAEQMSRSEPQVPSIQTPLAHEHHIRQENEHQLDNAPNALAIAREDHVPEQDGERSSKSLADESRSERAEPDRDQPPGRRRETSTHTTAVLGSRPDPHDPRRAAWQRGAAAIDRYRSAYNLEDDELALGPQPAAGKFQQRHDYRQTTIQVRDALRQLGHHVELDCPVDQRLPKVPGLEASELDRGNGFEP
ncbi:MAG: hypothetical protein JO372_26055 [Solirubrobacterales bacterium]|nr:hypothetical protein [Solirubrobacterales bacterium]